MKIELPNASTVVALLIAGLALGNTIRMDSEHQKQIAVLEQYVQTQQEIICLNANSLPNQFYEHKDSCFGVAASVMQRHK